MLQASRLYSFIDQKEGFTLHFLEGQKLIHDLALTHALSGKGFNTFRDAVLSFQTMVSFLKPGEGLGIYLDSEEPYFRLKIEMSDQGQMRTLLIPEDFNEFPQAMTGKCRVAKTLPNEPQAYTSIINLDHLSFFEVVNQVLVESYQVQCRVYISDISDQSVMIHKLPSINVDKVQTNYTLSIDEYWKKIKPLADQLHTKPNAEYSEIENLFCSKGLLYLGSKEIIFKCTCSRERMFKGIWSIVNSSGIDSVFEKDEREIEARCDYCKTNYIIKKDEFLN